MVDEAKLMGKQADARQRDVSRLQDVFVTGVVALVGAAVAFGVYSQAGFDIISSLSIGAGLFIWLLSAHFLITRMRLRALIENKLQSLAADVANLKGELEVTELLAEGHNDLMRGHKELEEGAKVVVDKLDDHEVKLNVLHKLAKKKLSSDKPQALVKQQQQVEALDSEFRQLSSAFDAHAKRYDGLRRRHDQASAQSLVLMRAQIDILELVVHQLGREGAPEVAQFSSKALQAIKGLRRLPGLSRSKASPVVVASAPLNASETNLPPRRMDTQQLQLNSPGSRVEPRVLPPELPAGAKAKLDRADAGGAMPFVDLASGAVADPNQELVVDEDDRMLAVINKAIQENRFELFLQPIVGLPGRELEYYEVFSRLRRSGQTFIDRDEYMPIAEDAELAPIIDNQMVLQAIQVAQRLVDRGKARILFCHLSMTSLKDADFYAEFLDFMEANQWLNKHIVFKFSQTEIEAAGVFEFERLDAIANFGFMFALDGLTSFELDFAHLAEHSFYYMKVDARLFLGDMVGAKAQIHMADLSHYLERLNMMLIVDGVERDSVVRQLRDYNVKYAEGALFCEPKPVRPDVFDKPGEVAA